MAHADGRQYRRNQEKQREKGPVIPRACAEIDDGRRPRGGVNRQGNSHTANSGRHGCRGKSAG